MFETLQYMYTINYFSLSFSLLPYPSLFLPPRSPPFPPLSPSHSLSPSLSFPLFSLSAIADTTIATWGGSSVASALSTAHDEDQDTNDPNLPHYHVDRHTPRHPRPLRRAYSPHDDQNITIGKKIKLEPQMNGNKNTPTSKKTGTCIHVL